MSAFEVKFQPRRNEGPIKSEELEADSSHDAGVMTRMKHSEPPEKRITITEINKLKE